ncbi:hypothetical protein NQ176_g8263 [Zarea fungicola]|uniref:Uncharacterized protein n=1 Tax=Zarea fungicola TaxID=93591 RepID=A0ACC1MTI1_9HYPO|nr:hypothetical protein NQ176_g8263 [Lecanicillium fungicola]
MKDTEPLPLPPYKADEECFAGDKDAKAYTNISPISTPDLFTASLGDNGEKSVAYFAPKQWCGLTIGTVFTELDYPIRAVPFKEASAFNKGRNIQRPSHTLQIHHTSGIPSRIFSLFRLSHDIQRRTYSIANLSVEEYRVDDKLKQLLGEQPQIKDLIKSQRKQAFFAYGIVKGKGVRITEDFSKNRGVRLNFSAGRSSASFHTSTQQEGHTETRGEDVPFGVTVLRLTLKSGVLKVEEFTEGAHFFI